MGHRRIDRSGPVAVLAFAFIVAACGTLSTPPPDARSQPTIPGPGANGRTPPAAASPGTGLSARAGSWRSPDRILVGTGNYFHLDIEIANGRFAGSWATYLCVSGDCSLGPANPASASGTIAADGTMTIDLSTAGSSRATWESLAADETMARVSLLDRLFGGTSTFRSLVCRPERTTGCRIPEPTRATVDAPAGFPNELPIPPGGRRIAAAESNQPSVYPMRLVVEVPNTTLDRLVDFFVRELNRPEWRVGARDRRDPASRSGSEPDPYVAFKVDSGAWFADIVAKLDSSRFGGPVATASYDVCVPRCPGQ